MPVLWESEASPATCVVVEARDDGSVQQETEDSSTEFCVRYAKAIVDYLIMAWLHNKHAPCRHWQVLVLLRCPWPLLLHQPTCGQQACVLPVLLHHRAQSRPQRRP